MPFLLLFDELPPVVVDPGTGEPTTPTPEPSDTSAHSPLVYILEGRRPMLRTGQFERF